MRRGYQRQYREFRDLYAPAPPRFVDDRVLAGGYRRALYYACRIAVGLSVALGLFYLAWRCGLI